MTGEENAKLDRALGRLEEAVRALQEDRQQREVACASHLAITNGLVSAFAMERGTREAIAAASKTTRESLDAEAKAARETLNNEAVSRRGQRHWLVERILQAAPILSALAGYLLAKGT